MNHTWTPEDHELVALLTAQGWTIDEIHAETGYPLGSIKHSRRISRISADKNNTRISTDVQHELDKLSEDILKLFGQLERISADNLELRQQLERISADNLERISADNLERISADNLERISADKTPDPKPEQSAKPWNSLNVKSKLPETYTP